MSQRRDPYTGTTLPLFLDFIKLMVRLPDCGHSDSFERTFVEFHAKKENEQGETETEIY
jgi:hypothetical protein